jgi:hypothetical protein
VLFKVGGKGKVRQGLQARGVVSDDIGRPWEVRGGVQVAMLPLVVTSDLAEVRGGTDGGDGAFAIAGHRWGVVTEILEGGVAHVVAVGHDVGLGDEGCVL